MIFWTTVNIVSGLMVAAIVVYMLAAYDHRFKVIERLVMVGVASGMVLRIGPILGTNILKIETPYDNWSVSLMHLSLLAGALCLLSRMEGIDFTTYATRMIRKIKG